MPLFRSSAPNILDVRGSGLDVVLEVLLRVRPRLAASKVLDQLLRLLLALEARDSDVLKRVR